MDLCDLEFGGEQPPLRKNMFGHLLEINRNKIGLSLKINELSIQIKTKPIHSYVYCMSMSNARASQNALFSFFNIKKNIVGLVVSVYVHLYLRNVDSCLYHSDCQI